MYGLFGYLFQPFVFFLILLALGLIFAWRKLPGQRRRLRLVIGVFAAFLVVSTPFVGSLAVGTLEWQYSPLRDRPPDIATVVVLGGGILPPRGQRTEAVLAPASIYRCLHAAELYAQGKPCLIIVAGGKVSDFPGGDTADLMRALLLRLGVKDEHILAAHDSRTTYEDVTQACALLQGRGAGNPVVVTDACHIPRAVRCFRKAGFEAVPAGCNHLAPALSCTSAYDFLPQVNGLALVDTAAHEWLGTAWYFLQGRL